MNSKKYFALAKENGIDVCELTLSKDTSLNFEIFKGEVISYSVEFSKGISSRGIFNNKLGASFTEKDDKDTYMFFRDKMEIFILKVILRKCFFSSFYFIVRYQTLCRG